MYFITGMWKGGSGAICNTVIELCRIDLIGSLVETSQTYPLIVAWLLSAKYLRVISEVQHKVIAINEQVSDYHLLLSSPIVLLLTHKFRNGSYRLNLSPSSGPWPGKQALLL